MATNVPTTEIGIESAMPAVPGLEAPLKVVQLQAREARVSDFRQNRLGLGARPTDLVPKFLTAAVLLVGMGRVLQADYGGGAMIDNVLRPIAEGFRGSMVLSKEIIRALLSVFSVLAAYVNAPRISDFNPSRRSE